LIEKVRVVSGMICDVFSLVEMQGLDIIAMLNTFSGMTVLAALSYFDV